MIYRTQTNQKQVLGELGLRNDQFELNLKEVLGVSASSSVVRNPVDVTDVAKTMNEMHVMSSCVIVICYALAC